MSWNLGVDARIGARKGSATSRRSLPAARDNPDVARTPPCDDGVMASRVLIVDDHADFRAFARSLLEAAGYEVVGEAHDGASALAAASALRPELVLLDVQLPDVDGFAVCERLGEDEGSPVVVLTSSRDASAFRRRLAGSSACGFVAKAELSGARLAALAGSA